MGLGEAVVIFERQARTGCAANALLRPGLCPLLLVTEARHGICWERARGARGQFARNYIQRLPAGGRQHEDAAGCWAATSCLLRINRLFAPASQCLTVLST